jgi:hypothetical protein
VKLEFHAWPPHGVARPRRGTLAIDLETGLAVFVNASDTVANNQRLAEERLRTVFGEATSPGGWIR